MKVNRRMQERVEVLWERFRTGKDEHTRNLLIENYLPLVKYTAERLATRLPDHVEVDDLFGDGTFGLIDAINEFDPDRGYKFETYAAPRIRGAMIDGLRAFDDRSRLMRSRSTLYESLVDAARNHVGVTGDSRHIDEVVEEIASQTLIGPKDNKKPISPEDLQKIKRDWHIAQNDVRMGALTLENEAGEQKDAHYVESHMLPSNQGLNFQDNDFFLSVLRLYPNPTERTLAFLYLFGDETMKEFGQMADMSESRVSQIMGKIAWFFVDYLHKHMDGGLSHYFFKAAGIKQGDLDGLYGYMRQGQGASALQDLLSKVVYSRDGFLKGQYEQSVPSLETVNVGNTDNTNNNTGGGLVSLFRRLKQTNAVAGISAASDEPSGEYAMRRRSKR